MDRRGAGSRNCDSCIKRGSEQIQARLDRAPATLERYGVSMRDLDTLTDAGMQVTRQLDNNLRPLTPDDARAIYRQILNGREDAL